MKIDVPEQKDYMAMAQIYNDASAPFAAIYSDDEKKALLFIETPDSLAEHTLSREGVLVRDTDGTVMGYAFFRMKNASCLWISSLYVHLNYQGRGVGTRLLEFIEKKACAQCALIVALETHEKAEWAIRFYAMRGYLSVLDKLSFFPYSATLEKLPVPRRQVFGKLLKECSG